MMCLLRDFVIFCSENSAVSCSIVLIEFLCSKTAHLRSVMVHPRKLKCSHIICLYFFALMPNFYFLFCAVLHRIQRGFAGCLQFIVILIDKVLVLLVVTCILYLHNYLVLSSATQPQFKSYISHSMPWLSNSRPAGILGNEL